MIDGAALRQFLLSSCHLTEAINHESKEAVVAIVGPGHFFGEGCLNGDPLRIATTRAVDDDCVVTRLEKATMHNTLAGRPPQSRRQ